MKKTIMLTALAIMSMQSYATIWRVNNNTNLSADFTSLTDANNDPNVLAGDTIHLEGSATDYSGTGINKRLTIIGPGYLLSQNPKTSALGQEARINYVDFNASSTGSQLIGVAVIGNSGVYINASNIVIKRCRIVHRVGVNFGISNISIVQNFFDRTGTTSNGSVMSYSNSGFPTGLYFNHNIVQGTLVLNSNPSYTFTECNNNIFDVMAITGNPSIELYAASFKNNILITATATVKINGISNFTATSNPAVTHNVGSSSAVHFGTTNNNIVVANMATTLFVPAGTNSPDGKYQLINSSPASSNGSDGTDRGAYGGSSAAARYQLSGLAPVPVVYEISTTGVASPTNGLPVTIKARTIQ